MFASGGADLFLSFCFACGQVYNVCMCVVASEGGGICQKRSISSSSSSILLCIFFGIFSYFSCPLSSFFPPIVAIVSSPWLYSALLSLPNHILVCRCGRQTLLLDLPLSLSIHLCFFSLPFFFCNPFPDDVIGSGGRH